MLGMYLLLTKHSLFSSTVKQSPLMRKTTGVAVLAWSASFAIGLAELYLRTKHEFDFYSLSILLDLFLVPIIIVLMLSMIQVATDRKQIIIYNVVPVALLITFIFTQSAWIIPVAIIYWGIDIVGFMTRFHNMQKRYKKKLKENFSDLQNRELKWINSVAVLFLLYAFLYLFGHLTDSPRACSFSYIISMIGWTYFVWHVEHQKALVNFWEENETLDLLTQIATEGETKEPAKLNPTEYSWLQELLEKECEAKHLYLRPDISIVELAKHLGTDRTCLNQYFNSQNTSFYNYINKLRINHAVEMIKERETGVSLDEISIKCGFNTPDTFRRAFSEQMGCTPALYIAKLVGRKDIR